MFLKRFYDDQLAQASFMVGCSAAGEAVVIDPNRDVQQYQDAAAAEGVRITHVTETHIHADFVSGSRALAHRTGAKLLLSHEGGEDWQYAFAATDDAALIGNGSRFSVGSVAFEVKHTPGHTPEHLSFIVTDTLATDRPMGMFTGDFIFAGDVGRPDLLERAAHLVGTMEQSARALFRSLQQVRELPEYLQLWPGHGAGSACGKALGAMPQTTLGYERVSNWAFQLLDEDAFVREVLAGQPDPPRYFAEMKRINREGPPLARESGEPPRIRAGRLAELLDAGALVVDTRPAEAFAAGHVPGTINIPLSKSFSTYAGSLIPYDVEFLLLVDDAAPTAASRATHDLAMIGLDGVGGVFGSGALAVWEASGRRLGTVARLDVREAHQRSSRGALALVDVRGHAEWDVGHAPGAIHVPLGELTDRLADLPADRPIAVICQGGSRSAIAASVLAWKGIRELYNVTGGVTEWARAGLGLDSQPSGVDSQRSTVNSQP